MARFTYYVSAGRRDAYLTGGERWVPGTGRLGSAATASAAAVIAARASSAWASRGVI